MAAVLVVLLVASLLAGLEAARDREAALDTAEPGRAPEGVVFYDLTGDERPEYVAIGDEILPVIPPRVEAWWVPFVPFFATVLSAVIAAVAVIVAQRPPRRHRPPAGGPGAGPSLNGSGVSHVASATHGTPNRSADGRHLAEGLGCVPVAEQVEVVER